jgi:cyclopropane-fatty-acyl-phospholipid synthase
MLDRFLESVVRARMRGLENGRLLVRDGTRIDRYGPGGDGRSAAITVHAPAFYRAVAVGGHIGAAESYVRGQWDADDLTDLIRLFAANRAVLDGLETGLARLSRPALARLRWLNRNTRAGSDRNIRAHYDLGNDFFAAFLDETMTYSAGIFEHPAATMKDASIAKYDRLCRRLGLTEADHVIEIGSGWGGFAIHAASAYGCQVTTTTISREQHALATRKIEDAGLSHRVTVLLQDYRDLDGEYDKLVSIEMVEAVGHQYLDLYFETCSRLLRPGGLAAIQAITILDDWYDPEQRQVDFIKKYIFPGSVIPSMGALQGSSRKASLPLLEETDLTPHYAETLRHWRLRFEENWPKIRRMDFEDPFRRLWRFYLAYCEGGFDEGVLRCKQLLFGRPAGGLSRRMRSEHPVVHLPLPGPESSSRPVAGVGA